MTSLHRLEIAIHELAAAKAMAVEFNWPKNFIDRIDLLMRGTADVRARMLNHVDQRRVAESDANRTGEPIVL